MVHVLRRDFNFTFVPSMLYPERQLERFLMHDLNVIFIMFKAFFLKKRRLDIRSYVHLCHKVFEVALWQKTRLCYLHFSRQKFFSTYTFNLVSFNFLLSISCRLFFILFFPSQKTRVYLYTKKYYYEYSLCYKNSNYKKSILSAISFFITT